MSRVIRENVYEKNLNKRKTLSEEQCDMIMKAYQQELSYLEKLILQEKELQ